jgi:hypothetical protein
LRRLFFLVALKCEATRIGVTLALNRHVVRQFNPDRKDHHWGKRKLKKDEG